jgi:dephospho-CoA kinase
MIGKYLLTECTEPFAVEMRSELLRKLELISDEKDEMRFIDPKVIGKLIFSNNDNLFIYNDITKEPIMFEVYRRLQTPGYKLITSALLVEANIAHICNNNVVIVHANEDVRKLRLKNRGYSSTEIKHREASHFSSSVKRSILQQKMLSDHYGQVLMFNNNAATHDEIEMLYKNMFRKQ